MKSLEDKVEPITEEEKERIVKEMLPYIKYTAFRLAWRLPPQLTVDDLVSVGVLGLLDALSRYKNNGTPIKSFVELRIKGAMLDEIRCQNDASKSLKRKLKALKDAHRELEKELGRLPEDEEVAETLQISLEEYYKTLQRVNSRTLLRLEDLAEKSHLDNDINIMDTIPDNDSKSPLDLCESEEVKAKLARLISQLPEKEKLVLSLYYWDELTMKEIGRVLEITEGRVCQIHNQAILRLRAKLEG